MHLILDSLDDALIHLVEPSEVAVCATVNRSEPNILRPHILLLRVVLSEQNWCCLFMNVPPLPERLKQVRVICKDCEDSKLDGSIVAGEEDIAFWCVEDIADRRPDGDVLQVRIARRESSSFRSLNVERGIHLALY